MSIGRWTFFQGTVFWGFLSSSIVRSTSGGTSEADIWEGLFAVTKETKNQSINQSINQPTNQPTDRPTDRSVNSCFAEGNSLPV